MLPTGTRQIRQVTSPPHSTSTHTELDTSRWWRRSISTVVPIGHNLMGTHT